MTRTTTTVAFAGFAVAAGLLGPLAGTAQAQDPPVSPGDCLALSKAQTDAASLPTSLPIVDCGLRHTAEITQLITIPSSIAKRGRTSKIVKQWTGNNCLTAQQRYLPEGTRGWHFPNRLLSEGFFFPTKSQWNAGHRWAACATLSVDKKHKKVVARTGSAASRDFPYMAYCARLDEKKGWVKSDNSCNEAKGAVPAVALVSLGWKNQESMSYPGHDKIMKRARKVGMRALDGANGFWSVPPADRSKWKKGARFVWVFSALGV